MGSLKTAALAGVFAAAFVMPALAADFLPPPPMPYAHPPLEVGGGWYLRGDVGVGILEVDDFKGTTVAGPIGDFTGLRKSIDDQAFVGVGVGYQFNNWLRADVTGEYRTAASFSFVEASNIDFNPATPDVGYNKLTGKVSHIVGLANAYFDLGNWHGVVPYVGAGIGLANHRVSGVHDAGFGDFAGGIGAAGEKTKTSLAWALHAGLGYDVSPNLKLEIGYRYLNMGDGETGVVNCLTACGGSTKYKLKEFDSHDLKLGMRWMLAGPVPLAVPGPEPLIRKY